MMDFDKTTEAIKRGDRATARAWLEEVGSWPSSDSAVQATTDAASRLLGFPVASDCGLAHSRPRLVSD